jgi:hypothetical protein
MATALETKQADELRQVALQEVQGEYAKYFEAINQHPRSLVGKEVPSMVGEGMEILRDSADAKDWQDAAKQQLAAEVKARAERKSDEVKPMMQTLHASIALFQQNHDLIPNTRQFDRELADRFAAISKPYELRVEGKLNGFSIPVQPLVDAVRAQLTAERAAKAAPPAPAAPAGQPTPQQQRAAEQTRNDVGQFHNPDAPQAGIPSKAGMSGESAEDFSTLWGTLGLPNLRL